MRGRVLSAVLATVLGLGGCGVSRPTPLSSLQLRAQAGRICASASVGANAIPSPGWTGAQQFLTRGLAVLSPELGRLRSLRPGGRAGATYRLALSSFQAELNALDRARGRLAHGADPVITVQRLQRELAPSETSARRAWQGLGIPSCLA